MRNLTFSLLLATGLVSCSMAQSPENRSWKLSNVIVMAGQESSNLSLLIRPDDLPEFAPGTDILGPGFNSISGFANAGDWSSSIITVQLGFHPFSDSLKVYRTNRTIRVGLTVQQFSNPLYNDWREIRNRMDTLMYSSNALPFGFVDSVNQRGRTAEYSATAIKTDAALTWSSDAQRRFSVYAGVGFNAGVFFTARTRVTSTEFNLQEVTDRAGNLISSSSFPLASDSSGGRMEEYQNKPGWCATLYVPLGIELRLGKSKGLWQQLRLFAEVRPALSVLKIPEAKTYALPVMQSLGGIRVTW